MEVTPKQLSDEIMNLLNNFKADFSDAAEGCHLTKVQMFALFAISRKDEIPMGQMAEALRCDPSNVTGIVDRLVSQNLIVREESAKDRRAKIIRLTDKGKSFVAQVEAEMPARLGCNQLEPSDRTQLCGLLSKLNALHPRRDWCAGVKQQKTTS